MAAHSSLLGAEDLIVALQTVRDAADRRRHALDQWDAREADEDLDAALAQADAIDPRHEGVSV